MGRSGQRVAHVMKSVEEADQVVTPHRVVVGTRNFEVTLLENAILFGQISGFPKRLLVTIEATEA